MSYFVDISEKHPLHKLIVSELHKHNIDLGKILKVDMKTVEDKIIASIVGLKPTATCKLDDGCTLDRSLGLGACHFSDIVTMVVFENGKIPKKVLSVVKAKLESKGFLVSPIGKEVAACKCFEDSISKFREFYIENEFEKKEFMERREFREGVYKVVAKDWHEFFFEGSAEELLKRA